MSHELAAAALSPIQDYLQELHARHAALRDGQVATYIPELAKANPDWFGICMVTTEGHVYEVGDSRQHFTIQSISKPFVYGLALEDNTRAEVLKKISVEPTGEAFNAGAIAPPDSSLARTRKRGCGGCWKCSHFTSAKTWRLTNPFISRKTRPAIATAPSGFTAHQKDVYAPRHRPRLN